MMVNSNLLSSSGDHLTAAWPFGIFSLRFYVLDVKMGFLKNIATGKMKDICVGLLEIVRNQNFAKVVQSF